MRLDPAQHSRARRLHGPASAFLVLLLAGCGSSSGQAQGPADTSPPDTSPPDTLLVDTAPSGQGDVAVDTVAADTTGCADTSACWLDQRDRSGTVVARCKGRRVCSGELELCVPLEGPPECIDIRCADKDEGDPCDDGNGCTAPDTCQSGSCTGKNVCECQTNADCADKEDGDLCNGTLLCDTTGTPHLCSINQFTVVTCIAGLDTACRKNTCIPQTGECTMVPAKDGKGCDDGNPCTAEDTCKAGQCAGNQVCACDPFTNPCKDDADKCNGVPFCDTSSVPWTCKTVPASVVHCNDSADTDCRKNTCRPVDGACEATAVVDGTGCDDGQACTRSDTCKSGHCEAGSNTCSCKSNADCADKDDGDLCNGVAFCDLASHTCEHNPASEVSCKTVDDTACLKVRCLPKEGRCVAQPAPDGTTSCDDANPCTQSDTCKSGKCRGGTNTCACTTDADCKDKDDGDLCNGTLYCSKGPNGSTCELNPATIVRCQNVDDTACRANTCNSKTGACKLQPRHELGGCDDGNPCTVGELCIKGACVTGTNQCKCVKDQDCAAKEDGNTCNGTLFCDRNSPNHAKWDCKVNPATIRHCPTGGDTACRRNDCDPKTGKCALADLPDNRDCGQPGGCRPKAFCLKGECEGPNVCVGCKTDADCGPEEDGNACNGTLICDTLSVPAACKVDPKTVVKCPADDPSGCSKWVCLYQDGTCAQTPVQAKQGEPCDDGDPCTSKAVCAGLGCKGKPTDCDDGRSCTKDGCDAGSAGQPGKGCVHKPDDTLCDDGRACTMDRCQPSDQGAAAKTGCIAAPRKDATSCKGDACGGAGACKAGVCVSTKSGCDDTNPCTIDTCGSGGTCGHSDATSGLPCNDGDGCTLLDACAKGKCGGQPRDCDDGQPCTEDACKQGSCVHAPSTQGPNCDDANACTDKDRCVSGKCKGTLVKDCDDGIECTLDTCGSGGCLHRMSPAACDDQNPCTRDNCAPGGKKCEHVPEDGPCPAGGSSCKQHLCTQGKCTATSQDLVFAGPLGEAGDVLDRVVTASDMVVGAGTCGAKAAPGGTRACVLARSILTGQVFRVVAGGKGDDVGRGLGMVYDGGVAIVGGRAADANSKVRPWIGLIGQTGKIEKDIFLEAAGHGEATSMHQVFGGYALVGALAKAAAGTRAAYRWRLDAGFKVLGSGPIGPGAAKSSRATGLAVHDGVIGAVGYAVLGGAEHSFFASQDSSGKLRDAASFAQAGGQLRGRDIVSTGDGGWALAETASVQGSTRLQVRRLDAKGNQLLLVKVADKVLNGVVGLDSRGGRLAVVGTLPGTGVHKGLLAIYDPFGREVARREYAGGVGLRGVAIFKDGTIAAVGNGPGGAEAKAWMMRASPAGLSSCEALGKCSAGAPCDDGKACTLDSCLPASGCSHKALATGSACDDGKLCTRADVCDSAAECAGTSATDGAGCDDGNLCTVADACKQGRCRPGPARSCDDGNLCTKEDCDAKRGCVGGIPGNAGAPCASAGCQVGTCDALGTCTATGQAVVFSGRHEATGDQRAEAVVPIDGGWLVAGSEADAVLVIRVPAGGKPTTSDRYQRGAGGKAWVAALVRDGKNTWLVGARDDVNGGDGILVERYVNSSGKREQGFSATIADPKLQTETALDALLVAPGRLGILGAIDSGGQTRTRYLRYEGASRKISLDRLLPGRSGDRPRAIALVSGKLVIAATALGPAGRRRALVRIIDPATGDQLGEQMYHGAVLKGVADVVPHDGGFAVAGTAVTDTSGNNVGIDQTWLMRASPDGQPRFQRTYPSTAAANALALVSADGELLLAGNRPGSGSKTDAPLLLALRRDGVLRADLSPDVPGLRELRATLPDPTGVFVAGTVADQAGGLDLWWAHAGPFGHVTCGAAGKCLTRKRLDCEDGQPCTIDSCDGATGCTHKARTGPCDGGPCARAASCQAGKCKIDSERLFARAIGGGKLRAVAIGRDEAAAAGTTTSGGKLRGWVAGLSQEGKVAWQHSELPAGFKSAELRAITRVESQHWVAVGSATDDKGARKGLAVRYAGTGQGTWAAPAVYGSPTDLRFLGVADRGASGAFAVGEAGPGNKTDAVAVAIDEHGLQVANWVSGTPGADGLVAATTRGSGPVAAGYVQTSGAGRQMLVLWFRPGGGQLRRRRTYGDAKADEAIAVSGLESGEDVLVLGSTTAVATGTGGVTGVDVVLLALDERGVIRWSRVEKSLKNDIATALAVTPAGPVAVATVNGEQRAYAFSLRGSPLWERPLLGGKATITGLAAYSSGELLMTGTDLTSGEAMVQRAGAFGYLSCNAAGSCAGRIRVFDCPSGPCEAATCSAGQPNGCRVIQESGPCQDDGQPCRAMGACKLGKCQPGKDKLRGAPAPAGTSGYGVVGRAIERAPDGRFYVAGDGKQGAFLAVLDPDGSHGASKPTLLGSKQGDIVRDLAMLPNGSLLAVGRLTYGSDTGPRVVAIGAGGLPGHVTSLAPRATEVHGIALSASGLPWITGTAKAAAGGSRIWIARLAPDGSVSKSVLLSASGAGMGGRALAGGGGVSGELGVAGVGHVGTRSQVFIAAVDEEGKLLWEDATQLAGGAAVAAIASTTTGYVMAGRMIDPTGDRPALFVVDGQQKKLVGSLPVAGALGTLTAVTTTADGYLAVAGVSDPAPGRGFVGLYTMQGARRWVERLPKGTSVYDLLAHPDNSIVATGGDGVAAMTVRLDAFGNHTCKGSGQCALRPHSSCAVSNPCHAAACSAAKGGCFTVPLQDGAACGGGKTCQNGVCKPAGP